MSRIYVLFLSLLVSALPVWAGPGHDHGHETAPDSVADFAPRLESAGSEVELVATAEGRKLTIYLDRLETNEPVDEATIEVSGEELKAQSAARVEEGVYTLEADWVAEPGTKALTFVVATADAADLLNGTLEIPQHSPMETAAGSSLSALLARAEFWLIVGLAALFEFVLAFAFRPARPPSEEGRAADTRSPSHDNVVRHKKLARVVFLALGPQRSAFHRGRGGDLTTITATSRERRRSAAMSLTSFPTATYSFPSRRSGCSAFVHR